jgi:hypothetical protein
MSVIFKLKSMKKVLLSVILFFGIATSIYAHGISKNELGLRLGDNDSSVGKYNTKEDCQARYNGIFFKLFVCT